MYNKIVIFGHSFISGLFHFLKSNGEKTKMNLGLENCTIRFLGEGSRKIDALGYHDVHTILQHEPDLLFIAMGDNDLRGNVHEICDKLLKWIGLFEDKIQKIIVCQTMPRCTASNHRYHFEEYNAKSALFNELIAEKVLHEKHIYILNFEFIKSRNFKRFFDEKGIHLNGTGYFYYQKEIRNAVVALKD